ncbi:MAG: FHA domain-containing protein [Euryarchaeota archaeon]|nr:FHA domain-containing protein [Euryarchaeota archaeon]
MGDEDPTLAVGDFRQLSEQMGVLGVLNRLELLQKLQLPRTVGEIRLAPARKDRDNRAERSISKQALESHLKKLVVLGFVNSRPGEREGRPVIEYVVNQARLFVFLDELRRISLIRPVQDPAGTATRGSGATRPVPTPRTGPALVLANGPFEGREFLLLGPGPWTIGRAKGLDVSLSYDPFVSKENSQVERTRDGFRVRTLPASRNGTSVNWRPLAPAESAEMRPGDAVGVGRSLLFLRG